MKTAFTLMALAAFAAADKSDFPSDSMFHAGCHMSVTLTGTTCDAFKTKAEQLIKDNVDTDSQYKGTMSLKEDGTDYIWSKRLTYNKKYTDDQLFEFATSGSDCVITAKSRSESMSYLDNSVNFCNMWNILSRVDGFSNYTCSECKTHPDAGSEASTCSRY